MQCTRVLAALWLALAASPLSLAQSPLKLPSGDDDYRQLIDEQRGGACEHCGVVTAIRSQQHEGPRRPNPAPPTAPGLTTAPLIGTGTAVQDARQATAPITTYVITVRYEDGSFAFIEQSDQPMVSKGDRVRVVEGRVEPRND